MRRSFGLGLLIGCCVATIFVAGFTTGVVVDRHQNDSVATDANLKDFLTAYQLITHRSYYRPFNRRNLVDAAINGMLAATGDPHTLYFSPSENQTANRQLNGSGFSGIGAIVIPVSSGLKILAPLPHSPSSAAGLRAGDVITRVNGQVVTNMPGSVALARIHGRAGTYVRLTVRRGRRRMDVPLLRGAIPPITAYPRELGHHIGYIRIVTFGITTNHDVSQALWDLMSYRPRALILDLRDNPGGYVEAAQHVVSHFLRRGVVAYEEDRSKQFQPLNVFGGESHSSLPMAVLVDAGTASAAEITAAALRDHHRAILIGTRTYGKGSMQSVYPLSDGASLRITDRLWLTPNKTSVQHVGLRPNITIPTSLVASGDPQLIAAEHYLAHHER